MGAYLSEPITEKVSSDEVGKNVAFGASSMQGWRISQEDAHNCCIDFDEDLCLFAVYDGHGGHEVATYSAQQLPDFIKQMDAYKRGDIRQALIDAFLEFDATLAKPEIINTLKEIAGRTSADGDKADPSESDDEESITNLQMEAKMPLEQLMAKYQAEGSNPLLKNVKNEKSSNKRVFSASPYLRGRRGREKASCSSLGASCSSSSSSSPSWNTNEADVSSSSQPCGSSSSSPGEKDEQKEAECPGSSEADQVLDSTTSNGDVHAMAPSVVGSTNAEAEPTKSVDMPDSSEDVNEKVSPSKPTQNNDNSNDGEINSGKSKSNFNDADSSKGGGDNVSSSSCAPVENGDAEQQENISSTGRRRIQTLELYKSILKETVGSSDDDDDDDDDDDEEEEEDFVDGSESDDTDNVESEDDDDDDDNEVDDELDDGSEGLTMSIREEPGSDSGCTAVVAILKGDDLYVANAGDSRCVLCREGEAVELSLDHKPEDLPEMERIVKAGGKVTADGRVNGGLNLSRALGDHAYKQNTNLPPQEQMISALPDVRHITLDRKRDEFMVLACDGIWNFMNSQEVVQFIRTRLSRGYENISQICEELFDHCLAPSTYGDGTGCDNMTAVIVQFKFSSPNETNSKESTEVAYAAKKRPVSPYSTNETNDCHVDGKTVEVSNKRPKTETSTDAAV